MKHLTKIYSYIFKYKVYVFWGAVFILFSNLFGIIVPPLVRQAIDGIAMMIETNQRPSFYGLVDDWFTTPGRVALFFGLFIVVSAVLKGILMFFMRQTIIVMSRYVEFDLKNKIYAHYQSLDRTFYGKNYTGDLMNRISDDVSKVRDFVGPAIMYALNLICLISFSIAIMLSINPQITWKVLIPLPVLAISIYLVSNEMNKRSERIQAFLSKITTFAQETFAGYNVIKTFGATHFYNNEMTALTKEYKHAQMSLVKVNAVFFPVVMALVGVSTLLALYFGGKEVINGNFTIGNVAEFIIYVNMLTWPVASLGYITSLVQRADASMKRINEFLDIPVEKNEGTINITEFQKSIRFENVSFTYPHTEEQVLNNVSFEIKVNEKLGIIGATGSGKSTVAKLLLGLYKPSSGTIYIDDMPLDSIELTSFRKLFGYVSQDVFLFSESIKENICFGLDRIPSEEVLDQIISDVQLKEELDIFAQGIETVIGERGITVSGGQKQRIAIARALILNAPILLLDDCLSALDTKTEAALKQALEGNAQQKTLINISHRISTLGDSDKIILLQDGEIEAQGTHQELIKNSKVYADLYQLQMAKVPTEEIVD